jgi:hypothetical protein
MNEHLREIRAKYGLPIEEETPPPTLAVVDARIGQWLEQEREFNREVTAHALARLMDDAENGLVGRIGPRGEKGDQGPPGKLPLVKVWKEHQISYSGDVVAYDGSTFQAIHDTARVPVTIGSCSLALAAMVPCRACAARSTPTRNIGYSMSLH